MVILAELDNSGEARLFNRPVAMPRDGGLDTDDPLGGRWVRLWPWPYGKQKNDVWLDATAPATPEGLAANVALKAEAAQLFYVAMTRARDYMVLAPRLLSPNAGPRLCTSWLELLPGTPRPLVLPVTGDAVVAAGEPVTAVVEDLVAAEAGGPEPPQAFRGPLPDGDAPIFPPRRLVPSAAAGAAAPGWRPITIGDRIPLLGTADMAALGEMLHDFFAADRPGADPGWRNGLAARLLKAWSVSALRPQDAVLAADRLWTHLGAAYPGAAWRREWPVSRVSGGQVLSGRVDLVVERPDCLAVYDHKSFPGGHERWPQEIGKHAPQLDAYAVALRAATGLPVSVKAIHLPIAGVVLVLEE